MATSDEQPYEEVADDKETSQVNMQKANDRDLWVSVQKSMLSMYQ